MAAMRAAVYLLLLVAVQASVSVQIASDKSTLEVNPIRKVVTMLQMMQKKVAAEGELDKEMHEKFMCWCKTAGADLEKSIGDSNVKIPDCHSHIAELEAHIAQLKAEIAQHQTDRQGAKDAIAAATVIRTREHKEWIKLKEDNDAQMAMIKKLMAAIGALEKGSYGLLQAGTKVQAPLLDLLQQKAGAAAVASVQNLMLSDKLNISDSDRQTLTEFLSANSDSSYTPQAGEIIGILKQMLDTMGGSTKQAQDDEAKSASIFELLVEAKMKEIDAMTKLIESKLKRIGEGGVEITMLLDELSDAEKSLIDDTKFLKGLKRSCGTAEAEFAERTKMRNLEMVALADTIKVLNDDDALDLFKKAIPSASLLQVAGRSSELRRRALAIVQEARRKPRSSNKMALELVALALGGKSVDFAEVIKMIDNMVALLKEEQLDDDSKKEFCGRQIDAIEDNVKELEHDIKNLEDSIADMQSTISTLTEEVKALEEGIVALDKSVAEATETRKEENEDFTELMAADAAAMQLLKYAKNRLNKFYNPKLYQAPKKREMTEAEKISTNFGGTLAPTAAPGGIQGTGVESPYALAQKGKEAPAPPPAQYGAYKKKGEESNGVIGMIDSIVLDLEKEMTAAETDEKNSQEEYEELMHDSAKKRADDSKSIQDKVANKAQLADDLEKAIVSKGDKTKELMANVKYLGTLHLECDWLLKNFGLRAEARAGEIDALSKAKAVLSGADFSLVQTHSSLRGR